MKRIRYDVQLDKLIKSKMTAANKENWFLSDLYSRNQIAQLDSVIRALYYTNLHLWTLTVNNLAPSNSNAI